MVPSFQRLSSGIEVFYLGINVLSKVSMIPEAGIQRTNAVAALVS